MNRLVIYYRGKEFEKEELETASWFFHCTDRRPVISKGDYVVARYSLYPFVSEVAKDIDYVGAKLINNYHQYQYIADLGNYVIDLNELTPRTWRNIEDIPEQGPFVLKGETNSCKSHWKKAMFAQNKKEAIEVHNRLIDDSLIGQQQIYIRQYVPLVKYMDGINGMPVTKEFRFFVAFGVVLCGGYYWANYLDDLPEVPKVSEVPLDFLYDVVARVGKQSNFYAIDVAQTQSGEWIVVELNDGCHSGLSCNQPFALYENLSKAIKDRS